MSGSVARSAEQFADVNGIRICFDTFGEKSDPTILLIMGLGSQMVLWDEAFCASLAGRGFHVVRYDNRDAGRSSRIDAAVRVDFADLLQKQARGERIESPYSLRDMAGDGVGLLDHLGVERAHVVGMSMGGMITQEMAFAYPERMLSMTSIMSSTGNRALPPPTPEAAMMLMTPPPLTRPEYLANFEKTWRVLRPGSFPEDEAKDRARGEVCFERGLNPMGTARQLLAVFASGDRRAKLAKVTTPALVIHGDVDPLVRVEAGRDTAASIPGAQLRIVKGMGHALPIPMWPEIIGAIASHANAHAA